MNRFASMALSLSALALTAGAYGQSQIQVVVDGNPVVFNGQGPAMVQDRVLVPLRGVLEAMQAHVNWNPSNQTVTADRPGYHIQLTIGQTTGSVNGNPVTLDVPAQIMNGSTMVPLRFVGEELGETVHWDANSHTVTITAGDYNVPPPREREHHRHPQLPPPPTPPPPVNVQQTVWVLPPNMVIPANLNIDLDSSQCRPGMRFDCVVPHYPGLPDGCRIEGVVSDVVASIGGGPGGIDFQFDTIIAPNGRRVHINGQPMRLDQPGMRRDNRGRYMAPGGVFNRFVVVNDGGRPRFVNVHDHGPLHGPAAWKEASRGVRRGSGDVHLAAGTSIGIRLSAGVRL
jgi:hypothetical protein